MTDFGDTRWPVARKDHRCEWCGEVIPQGAKHAQFAGKWEGEWQHWRMHSDCLDYADTNDALSEGFTPYENERPGAEKLRKLTRQERLEAQADAGYDTKDWEER